MTYYDHATLLALRLGPWAGPRAPKAYDAERMAAEHLAREIAGPKAAGRGFWPSALSALPWRKRRVRRAANGAAAPAAQGAISACGEA